jgi:hypothetical protein
MISRQGVGRPLTLGDYQRHTLVAWANGMEYALRYQNGRSLGLTPYSGTAPGRSALLGGPMPFWGERVADVHDRLAAPSIPGDVDVQVEGDGGCIRPLF